MSEQREKLLEAAHSALKYSYTPYSHFKVAAAILTKEGKVFTGCNIENVTYGLTICAERVALFKAISHGFRNFDSIAICSSNEKPTFPCGSCRQVLFEFEPNIKVYLENDNVDYELSHLLPYAFTSKQM